MKKISFFILACLFAHTALSQPGTVDNHIKVDQFGYPRFAQKIAVISNPQTGYNANLPFTPGASYQLRKKGTNALIYSATITSWNAGATHLQSGDKAWWFDFSSVTAPGSYYIYDAANDKCSYGFTIGDDVYNTVLKRAVKMFFYQRCGIAKGASYAGNKWQDAKCHEGAQQDLDCRLVSNTSAATSKDLHGGWHDAGDYNKYVPFTFSTLTDLLLAYEENQTVWRDDFGIPQSGNGRPDLLDEVKYELDWMLRMIQTDGSVLHKVSVTDFASASPPSADGAFRRYAPASTTATLTASAVFALAAIQFQSLNDPTLTSYVAKLKAKAEKAWTWADSNPNVIATNAGFSSATAEVDSWERDARKLCAAAYLFALTGKSKYKTYFDANYQQSHLMQWSYAYPFEAAYQDGLLYYTKNANATPAVKTAILNTYSSSMKTSNADNLPAFLNHTDAYRAFLSDQNYTWNSSQTKASQGNMFLTMNVYGLNAANSSNYRNAAFGFVNYFHGVNPTAYCYLTNMSAYGAEFSVPEFYHSWFGDGTIYDNASTSPNGPAPGYLPGGANPAYQPDAAYTGPPISPPQNQPIQKSFKAWNTSWPENSWEITEAGIYTQAAFCRLLSKFASAGTPRVGAADLNESKNNFFTAYPNPFENKLYVDFELPVEEQTQIWLSDVNGKTIYSTILKVNEKLSEINTSHISPGFYFLKTFSAHNSISQKLVKLK
ncbi:MAG: glycoside hydrolase family 9 protein [Bacteroidota bacterium]